VAPVSVSISEGVSADDEPRVILSLSREDFTLSIWASPEDLSLFHQVRTADWDLRRSIRIGESAGSAVIWASNQRTLFVMIGSDDETWDIAFSLPLATLDEIMRVVHLPVLP
jgi:hypothetical protein